MEKFMERKRRARDADHMRLAIETAVEAKSRGDFPAAAVLVWAGGMKLVEHDTRYADRNPINYAIINLINKAFDTLGRVNLNDAVLYSTVEPNTFCALAIAAAGIKEVVFGAYDDGEGYVSSKMFDHTLLDITSLGGVLSEECYDIMPFGVKEHMRHE